MRTRGPKEVEITKEIIIPPSRRKPAFEQPRLELPLPLHRPETPSRQDEDTKEITVRGVWTIEI